MQNNLKIVIGLLILIIILLGLGVYLLFTRTTPDQKVETNQIQNINPSQQKTVRTGLDLNNQYAQQYGALFTIEFDQPANFNEKFRIVAIKCAETECYNLYALHKITGETYKIADGAVNYNISGEKIIAGSRSGMDDIIFYNETTNTFEFKPSDNIYGI